MQRKPELEKWYDKTDPWGYRTNPDDKFRKEKILEACKGPWKRALDIGAGEGWISKDIKADKIYGIELSDNAADRFPKTVERIHEPEGEYDLILCAGMLYNQYDHKKFTQWILDHASNRVVIAGIADWLILDDRLLEDVVRDEYFDYREYRQRVLTIKRN